MRDDDFGDACQQKFQIQILELHVGFSIVDNTELRTRARALARDHGHPRAGDTCHLGLP